MSKVYEYPTEFEGVWKSLKLGRKESRKAHGYAVYLKMKERCACEDLEEQAKDKNKWIKELLENQSVCETCGCKELLCGDKGPGCSRLLEQENVAN